MITDEEAARRLARAICSDIVLYEGAASMGLAPAERSRALAAPIAEGRELFASKVSGPLSYVFDEAVKELVDPSGAAGAAMSAPANHPRVERDPAPSASAALPLAIGAVLVVLIAGIVAFVLLRG